MAKIKWLLIASLVIMLLAVPAIWCLWRGSNATTRRPTATG